MAKIKQRGKSGAAKNYVTRGQAIRKLQITIADFRRLCILKGIYPREPTNKKRANKGSSAPASFYYNKDIQYLLHEPLLVKFREHKAFAKKLARAVGRQEWGLAKNLEDTKPVLRLDHLVKERYPTFTLALQDLQDPLNLIHLFSRLPTNPIPGKAHIPSELITDCARLISEWKVWAIRTNALRKTFLGIKGVYYECSVSSGNQDVPVRWLEGYEFQQYVPSDVDFRVLLTFVELYKVLIGFVLFKLYTEENLVYPPPLDKELDERGESVGAFKLVQKQAIAEAGKSRVSQKAVRRAIKGMEEAGADVEDADMEEEDTTPLEAEAAGNGETEANEEFIERPAKEPTDDVLPGSLTTYNALLSTTASSSLPQSRLFSKYTFYLSRETSSRTWEFVLRSLGGKIITAHQLPDPSTPEGNAITHVIIDRPMTEERKRVMENGRKWVWVQPQWVADCVNRGKVLGHQEYAPGKLLPPHLSPWDSEAENDRPWMDKPQEAIMEGDVGATVEEGDEEEEDEEEEDEEESAEEDDEEETSEPAYPPALLAAASNPSDKTLLHAAELEAESAGISSTAFKSQLQAATKSAGKDGAVKAKGTAKESEEDLRKIMMSNKKAKLYKKMKYGDKQRQDEKDKLDAKRLAIEKRKRKEARAAGKA